jgi:hypothetical protein
MTPCNVPLEVCAKTGTQGINTTLPNMSEEKNRTAFIEIRIAPPMLVGEECLGDELSLRWELCGWRRTGRIREGM